MKIYLVGHKGPDHNLVKSIHKNYKNAFNKWDELRKELLENAKSLLKEDILNKEISKKICKSLSCINPNKIDNSLEETPYIQEFELED